MSVHINDFPVELLCFMFEFLPYKQLVRIESVCTKWQSCVLKMLQSEETLKPLQFYSEKFHKSFDGQMDFWYIDQDNIEILMSILIKRPNIKSINLDGIWIFTKNVLITIAKLCPKLQRINLQFLHFDKDINFYESCYELINISIDGINFHQIYRLKPNVDLPRNFINEYLNEIEEFAKLIGPQLTYINLINLPERNIELTQKFLKHLKNIEKISFYTEHSQDDKMHFNYLKSYENLHEMEWTTSLVRWHTENSVSDDVINTIQKMKYLNVDTSTFAHLNFEMNNLTELTLDGEHFQSEPQEIEFKNLKKFKIINFFDINFMQISKMKFPRLESIFIQEQPYQFEFPNSFINQIKHIKQLTTNRFRQELITCLKSIETIQLYHGLSEMFNAQNIMYYNTTPICQLEMLSTIKSLQKVIIKTRTCDFNIAKDILKFKQNSNAQLNFKIYFCNEDMFHLQFDQFKKQFEEAKKLTKFNMKIYFSSEY